MAGDGGDKSGNGRTAPAPRGSDAVDSVRRLALSRTDFASMAARAVLHLTDLSSAIGAAVLRVDESGLPIVAEAGDLGEGIERLAAADLRLVDGRLESEDAIAGPDAAGRHYVVEPLIVDHRVRGLLLVAGAPGQPFADDERALYRTSVEALAACYSLELLRDRLGDVQRQLVETNRLAAIGLLTAGIGHEINNPAAYMSLGVKQISRHLRALREGAADPGPHLDRIEAILADVAEGTRRITTLMGELRRFSRGTEQMQPGGVDVNDLLRSSATLVDGELRTRARLEASLEELPRQPGAYHRLGQVFLNLLVNASQAIPPGSPERHTVRVESRREGDRIQVVVRDSGPGIPDELIDRVFEPFFTTKPRDEGTGLGLSVSLDIVTRLGGTLSVERCPVLGGCAFTVVVPLLGEEGAAPPPPPVPPQPRARILVADDERTLAMSLYWELSRRHDVTVALDGDEAWSRIEESRFDAVLCDLRMPGKSGAELYRRVLARDEELARRFIFLTGVAASSASGETGFLAQLDRPVLEKPFSSDELWQALRLVLAP